MIVISLVFDRPWSRSRVNDLIEITSWPRPALKYSITQTDGTIACLCIVQLKQVLLPAASEIPWVVDAATCRARSSFSQRVGNPWVGIPGICELSSYCLGQNSWLRYGTGTSCPKPL